MDPITLNRIQSVAPTTKATTSAAVNKHLAHLARR